MKRQEILELQNRKSEYHTFLRAGILRELIVTSHVECADGKQHGPEEDVDVVFIITVQSLKDKKLVKEFRQFNGNDQILAEAAEFCRFTPLRAATVMRRIWKEDKTNYEKFVAASKVLKQVAREHGYEEFLGDFCVIEQAVLEVLFGNWEMELRRARLYSNEKLERQGLVESGQDAPPDDLFPEAPEAPAAPAETAPPEASPVEPA